MAKGQPLSHYQQGIVRRYYEQKDTLATQKLGELVSDLYLESDTKKAARLWERAKTALLNAGANKARVEKLTAEKNLKALAEVVSELF